jgi:hypothetical protein
VLLRLLTAVPVALAATFAVPATAHAAAPGCVATATPPRSEPGRAGVHASGTFACVVPSSDLFVEVCVEELDTETLGWGTLGCSQAVLNDGGLGVTADVTVEQPADTTVLRTYVTGSNGRGDTASGTSAPVVWLRCGCP